MMNMNMNTMMMSSMLAEDVGAPEIRNPRHSGMRPAKGWLARLLRKLK